MEAIMLLKSEISSLKVLMESKLEEANWVKMRYKQLNLISEKRLLQIVITNYINKKWLKYMTRKSNLEYFRKKI
jgi:hypothetical protein